MTPPGERAGLSRREFVHVLAAAAAAGLSFEPIEAAERGRATARQLYEVPHFGNVSLLHITDCHAQLLPIYYREPSENIGIGASSGRAPHLVGTDMLRHYGVTPGTPEAYALSCLDFVAAARRYGKVGGFAHLATLVKSSRASRPGALLLDGGDSWQGSAVSLWTRGADMIDAQLALGVDIMTGHWEFTYGAARVEEVLAGPFKNRIEFVAHNVRTADFGDPVFAPYALREVNGVQVAVIGQAFPYTPIAHPRRFVSNWSFGIQEEHLQQTIDAARGGGAQVVVLLSHNGMDVDLKLASRVRGLDAILGGHTHDAVPRPVVVSHGSGQTLVTNAGSNGKFLGVLDLDVRGGRVRGYHYRLLPVLSHFLQADPAMETLIERHRAPYEASLLERLSVSEGLLYRRGNFNGSFDQLILDSLMSVKDTEIAFSPGFRWGTTLLPGDAITRERLLDQTAITYPTVTVNVLTGARIKEILEDVCDNLFNPDPYYQQGGDMVRVGGMTYACRPAAAQGHRICDLRLNGKPIDAAKTYRVAGWASVADDETGEPVWDVVAQYLRAHERLATPTLQQPAVFGADRECGLASSSPG